MKWFIYYLLNLESDTTEVEGENSQLRQNLARLHRTTFCYLESEEMLKHSIRLVIHNLKYDSVPLAPAFLEEITWFIFGSATPILLYLNI